MNSWVPGAAGSLFDVDNLPYGVFSRAGEEPRVGVRIGRPSSKTCQLPSSPTTLTSA